MCAIHRELLSVTLFDNNDLSVKVIDEELETVFSFFYRYEPR